MFDAMSLILLFIPRNRLSKGASRGHFQGVLGLGGAAIILLNIPECKKPATYVTNRFRMSRVITF